MSKETIAAYVYDFLSRLFEEKIPLRKIILFGSVARNEYNKKSDIDLFIEPKQKSKIKEVEKKIKSVKKRFESEKEHTWKLKGIDYPISEIVGSLDDKKWENLRRDIVSNGILLYGKYEELPKKIRHHALINYSLKNLQQKKKMQFLRALFGYSVNKNKKVYKQEGLLQKTGGIKLTNNVLFVPLEEIIIFKNLFDKFRVKIEIREVWVGG